jgi:hypothetical protein
VQDYGQERLLRRTYGRNPADVTYQLGSPSSHANASRRGCNAFRPLSGLLAGRLSNDVPVNAPTEDTNGASERPGVLSNLPRTRPQRSSPRRAAARRANAAAESAGSPPAATNGRPPPTSRKATTSAPKGSTSTGARASAKAPAKSSAKASVRGSTKAPARKRAGDPRSRAASSRAAAAPIVTEAVPRQGFESESERAGGAVHPPGGAELVASAVEIVGELAKAGLSTGERVLKDVLSRLPLS